MTPNNARGLWSWEAASGLDNLQLAWKKSRQWKHALVASSLSASAGQELASACPLWHTGEALRGSRQVTTRVHAVTPSTARPSAFSRPLLQLGDVFWLWSLKGSKPNSDKCQERLVAWVSCKGKELNPSTVNQVHHCERRGRRHRKPFGSYHHQGRPHKPLITRGTGSWATANKYLHLKKSKSSLIWERCKKHQFLMG